MEDTIVTLTRQRIKTLYQDAKKLLIAPGSYYSQVKFSNVELYFTFLESTLQQPFNRLEALKRFLVNGFDTESSKMYPFRELSEYVEDLIEVKYNKALTLAEGLEASSLDPELKLLTDEDYTDWQN